MRKMMKRKQATHSDSLPNKQSKNRDQDRVPSLSEEIIFTILLRVSAEFCHHIGRLVCKSWCSILSTKDFKEKHLAHSNPIFFYDDCSFLDVKRKRLQATLRFKDKLSGDLLATSNGCLLFIDSNRDFFVKNPVTRQLSKLPPLDVKLDLKFLGATIACVSHSYPWKLIVVCKYECLLVKTIYWTFLTVGSNMSWTLLSEFTPRLVYVPSPHLRYEPSLFSVGDLVIDPSEWYDKKRFLALDLHVNYLHLVDCPKVIDKKTLRELIPMGKDLYTVSIFPSDDHWYKLSVWKMVNFQISEWEEVFKSEISREKGLELSDEKVFIHAWLEKENHKTLVFKKKRVHFAPSMVAYEFGETVRKRYFLPIGGRKRQFHGEELGVGPQLWHHMDSLISW